MTNWERRLGYFWLFTGLITAVAFLSPGMFSTIAFLLIVTIIGVPIAFALNSLPSLFLYLTAMLPIYLLLRWYSRGVAALVSLATVVGVMITIPLIANHLLEERVTSMISDDFGAPIILPANSQVALLHGYHQTAELPEQCERDCQRMLLSGTARQVLIGNTAALHEPTQLYRYWIDEERDACSPSILSDVRAENEDVGKNAPFPRPFLSDKLYMKRPYRCIYRKTASLNEADAVLAQRFLPDRHNAALIAGRFDPRFGSIDHFDWKAAFVRENGRLERVMKRSRVTARPLAVPLQINPPFWFDVKTPGSWRRGKPIAAGLEQTAYLSELIKNDVRVRDLVD